LRGGGKQRGEEGNLVRLSVKLKNKKEGERTSFLRPLAGEKGKRSTYEGKGKKKKGALSSKGALD